MDIRIGNGYDVHALAEGLPLWLGGVKVESPVGCIAHSDGDVAIHSLCDALLGALGLLDIGYHFPDSDEKYRGASSMHLLVLVRKMLNERGYTVSNVDATVVLQSPKIAPYIERMISNIAFALEIDESRVNVKATTEEHLGFTGSGEGAAAHAVALVEKN